jgi:glutamyl-tRNA synthetase
MKFKNSEIATLAAERYGFDLTVAPADQPIADLVIPRGLPQGTEVTRFAPSPTGSLHLGNLYTCLTSERLARTSNQGVFYFRLEDTDKEREVPGAAEKIPRLIDQFGITIDEGWTGENEHGEYGPYRQSERSPLYRAALLSLIYANVVYLDFETREQKDGRLAQAPQSRSLWRSVSEQRTLDAIEAGLEFVPRMRAEFTDSDLITEFRDRVFSNSQLAPSQHDEALARPDGSPMYHLCHVVDDCLMGTTTVVRGSEWLSSTAIDLALAEQLGLQPPQYAHMPTLNKIDPETGGSRKLSKRKDFEANVEHLLHSGYASEAVIDYLLGLIGGENYDKLRREGGRRVIRAYTLGSITLKGNNNPKIVDIDKLNFLNREFLSSMTASKLIDSYARWFGEFAMGNPEAARLMKAIETNPVKAEQIFSIERGVDNSKGRKDVDTFEGIYEAYGYLFADIYDTDTSLRVTGALAELTLPVKEVLTRVTSDLLLTEANDADTWLDRLRAISTDLGFANSNGTYKRNPEAFVGSFGDFMKIVRIAVCGKNQSPDMYVIRSVLGHEEFVRRTSLHAV